MRLDVPGLSHSFAEIWIFLKTDDLRYPASFKLLSEKRMGAAFEKNLVLFSKGVMIRPYGIASRGERFILREEARDGLPRS